MKNNFSYENINDKIQQVQNLLPEEFVLNGYHDKISWGLAELGVYAFNCAEATEIKPYSEELKILHKIKKAYEKSKLPQNDLEEAVKLYNNFVESLTEWKLLEEKEEENSIFEGYESSTAINQAANNNKSNIDVVFSSLVTKMSNEPIKWQNKIEASQLANKEAQK